MVDTSKDLKQKIQKHPAFLAFKDDKEEDCGSKNEKETESKEELDSMKEDD